MKHVLITGGSDGLGKVMAKRLIADGFKVTILSRDETKTRRAAEDVGCEYVAADVSDYQQVSQAIEQAGPIDILINNAGLWVQGPLEENDPERAKQVMDVNATGPILCAHAVIPGMKKQGHGRIININSNYGFYVKAERAVYSASKWAMTGLTKALQEELKPHGIAVTGFYSRAISNTHLFAGAGLDRKITNGLDPETIADAIVYICKLPDGINVPEMGLENLKY